MNGNNTIIDPDVNNQQEKKQPRKTNLTTIIAIIIIVQLFLAIFFGIRLFKSGYQRSKENTAGTIRKEAYNSVYDLTENANHVSNKASITLEGLREEANLEVLEVNTSYVYVSDEDDKKKEQTIWYKIPGMGTFTVDLRMTEFIIDNDRQHVLVRTTAPVISQFEENYDKIEKLYFKDDRWFTNGSIREGEELARKMLAKAHTEMMRRLEMNPSYFKAAEESAEKIITSMIKALNPSLPQISVTVVFDESASS